VAIKRLQRKDANERIDPAIKFEQPWARTTSTETSAWLPVISRGRCTFSPSVTVKPLDSVALHAGPQLKPLFSARLRELCPSALNRS
jgi:hypothetical protein